MKTVNTLFGLLMWCLTVAGAVAFVLDLRQQNIRWMNERVNYQETLYGADVLVFATAQDRGWNQDASWMAVAVFDSAARVFMAAGTRGRE